LKTDKKTDFQISSAVQELQLRQVLPDHRAPACHGGPGGAETAAGGRGRGCPWFPGDFGRHASRGFQTAPGTGLGCSDVNIRNFSWFQ